MSNNNIFHFQFHHNTEENQINLGSAPGGLTIGQLKRDRDPPCGVLAS